MAEGDPQSGEVRLPRARVQERSQVSVVWFIPALAVLLGGWLIYTALTERGPEITISFGSAAGLEAGRTKVRYKDVEIGQVESIELTEDLSRVLVRARLVPAARAYLTEGTRFWVVRARVSAGQISGIDTLFSGAFIGIDPSTDGDSAVDFRGLDTPPVVTSDEPGRLFNLRAQDLGSIDIESPVYYRWLRVGRVVGYDLDQVGGGVNVKIFIEAPHDLRVRSDTRFWNASGLDVSFSAEGVRVDSVSLLSMLIGGVAFDSPSAAGDAVPEGAVFDLYPSRDATSRPQYRLKRQFLLYFDQSVAGLNHGAPVEFRGIRIGQVRDVRLVYDPRSGAVRVPVVVEVEPERIALAAVGSTVLGFEDLVAQGMRAQLKTGNLITGQLAIEFDFHPDAPPAKVVQGDPYPVLPTVPSPVEAITTSVAHIVERFEKIPVEQIGRDLAAMLADLREVSRTLNSDVAPSLASTLSRLDETLSGVEGLVAADSPTGSEVRQLVVELSEAATSLRLLAEHLEQHPESLIRGKSE